MSIVSISARLIGSSSELDTGVDIRTACWVYWVPIVSVGGLFFWVAVLGVGQVVLAPGPALGLAIGLAGTLQLVLLSIRFLR